MEILLLFAMYGVAFGFQNKLPTLWQGSLTKVFSKDFVSQLLKCTYCIGFHSGWMVYLLYVFSGKGSPAIGELLIYAFAGAAFSYSVDTYVQKLEESGLVYEDSEEE